MENEFEFTKTDKVYELHPAIRAYFPTFLTHRFEELVVLQNALKIDDFDEVRAYCHKQRGVAASYKCFKLEEITEMIHHYAKDNNLDPIRALIPTLENYLEELKTSI